MGSVMEDPPGYLIDTHVLLWWLFDDPKLSEHALQIIRNPENMIFVSSASSWEIATKYRLGRLAHAHEAVERLPELIQRSRMNVLPIMLEHALLAGRLPGSYKDPFDRMLIAQGQLEKLPIVTSDTIFSQYDVSIIW
jgi:PIN domain nuclease of toxin-antitoxin system